MPAKPERLDVENDDARQRRLQSLLEGLDTSDTASLAQPSGLPKFDFGERSTAPFTPNTDVLSRVQAFLPQLEASNLELLERARSDPRSVDMECVEEEEGKRYIEMNLGLGVFEQKRKQKRRVAARAKSKAAAAAKAAVGGDGDEDEDEAMDASSSSSRSSGSSSDSSSSGSDSDSEEDGSDDPSNPLTAFFASLRHGQTFSMDSSDSEARSSDDEASQSENDQEEGSGERPTRPLPKRAITRRPVIEVIGVGEKENATTT